VNFSCANTIEDLHHHKCCENECKVSRRTSFLFHFVCE